MSDGIRNLIEAADGGDWTPLLNAAGQARGKYWAENARCSGQDTDMFFPSAEVLRSDPNDVKRKSGKSLNRPLSLCAACPLAVAARCLVESLKHDEEFGIRAGLLASERSGLRSAWQARIDPDAVSAALRGSTAVLTEAEEHEVISRFSGDPTQSVKLVARALGIPRPYLRQLAREHRQRHAVSEFPSTVASNADAA